MDENTALETVTLIFKTCVRRVLQTSTAERKVCVRKDTFRTHLNVASNRSHTEPATHAAVISPQNAIYAEDTRVRKPAPILGVENRNRLSERVSCKNDSDFRLRKSAPVFDSD